MHYEDDFKSGANARSSSIPPFLGERLFCEFFRDTRISYYVQVPFSHLLFTELKKKGDFCSFHYNERDGYVTPY